MSLILNLQPQPPQKAWNLYTLSQFYHPNKSTLNLSQTLKQSQHGTPPQTQFTKFVQQKKFVSQTFMHTKNVLNFTLRFVNSVLKQEIQGELVMVKLHLLVMISRFILGLIGGKLNGGNNSKRGR